VLESRLIRNAFENIIQVFGNRASIAIIDDLSHNDVILNDSHLSLSKLANGLTRALGVEPASLLMQHVLLELDRLHTADPMIRSISGE
jgi:hypothetical protein